LRSPDAVCDDVSAPIDGKVRRAQAATRCPRKSRSKWTTCVEGPAFGAPPGIPDRSPPTGLSTVSGEAVRQLCCDAELNRVVTRGKSTILDYGTTTRLAWDSQYHALVARDGGCRWPGCDRPPGSTEAHHLKEVFTENGPTHVNEMVLGCSTHHDYLHHKGWTYVGSADDLYLRQPDGTLLPAPPRGPIFATPRPLQLSTA
jgi:hypothetical protein